MTPGCITRLLQCSSSPRNRSRASLCSPCATPPPPTLDPFRYKSADCIFHAAAVLVNALFFGGKRSSILPPPGITASNVFFAVIKVADGLGAHKAMRAVLDKMKLLRFPANWRSRVELASIMALGRPFTDPEELCPRCARCGILPAPRPPFSIVSRNCDRIDFCPSGTPNSIIRDGGDACQACRQPFYRCLALFSAIYLPMLLLGLSLDSRRCQLYVCPHLQAALKSCVLQVEFQPDDGIMDEEAEVAQGV